MYFEQYIEYRPCASRITLKTPSGEEIQIEIGPGSSFGARHKTTRLCLKGIEEIFKRKKIINVLDLGCGTGVLGISARILGAECVLAIDIDPLAVEEARMNALRNGIESNFFCVCGSLEDIRGRFDLVIANIVTDDLIRMSKGIKLLIDDGGLLLVSGISELKKEKALKGFTEAGFSLNRELMEESWVAMILNDRQ